MLAELVPDDLWAVVEPLLPLEPSRAKGGRPRLPARSVLAGIVYVLKTGVPWQMLPPQLGFGSGKTCWRRLIEWHQAGYLIRLI